MKTLFALLLLFAITTDPVTRIAKVNRLKKEAKKAMEVQNYSKALLHYTKLIDSLAVDDDNLKMNLANAAYNLSYGLEDRQFLNEAGKPATNTPLAADTTAGGTKSTELKFAAIAENKYLELVNSADKTIASSAYNQRGIIAYIQSEKEKGGNKEGLFGQSLAHFKNALRKNSANEAARYNYELLKKMKREQENQKKQDQEKQNQKQDQEKQDPKKQKQKEQQQKDDQKKQEQKEKEKEKKQNQEQKEKKQGQKKEEQKPEDAEKTEEQKEKEKQEKLKKFLEKLREMKISREKAEMILEAMKNNEIQYVQQNKRKAKKKKNHSKPDW